AARAAAVQGIDDIGDFLIDEQIDLVMWDTATQFPPDSAKWKLGQFLSRRGFPEFQLGSVIVYRVAGRDLPYTEQFALQPAAPLLATDQSLQVTAEPGVVVPTGARSARYGATYDCDSSVGSFVARINWNNGVSY